VTSKRDPLAELLQSLKDPPEAGEPLDLEKLVAYSRGGLSPAEREAMEERLTHFPEEAELLLDWLKFAEEEDALPRDQVDTAWKGFERRLTPPPRSASFWASPRIAWRMAAAFLFLAGLAGGWALLLQRELATERQPQANVALVDLYLEDPERGESPEQQRIVFSPGVRQVTLVLTPGAALQHPPYRGQILDARKRVVWSASLVPNAHGTFAVSLTKDFLVPGFYKIEVYDHNPEGYRLLGGGEVQVSEKASD